MSSVIDFVKDKLGFKTDTALTGFLGIDKSCVWDWRKRLGGGIPSKHWDTLIDEGKRQRKKITLDDLRG